MFKSVLTQTLKIAIGLALSISAAAVCLSLLVTDSSPVSGKTISDSDSDRDAVLRLRNGNAVSGSVLSSIGRSILLRWSQGDVAFDKHEVRTVQWGRSLAGKRPYEFGWGHLNNPVLVLQDSDVIDGQILRVADTHIVVREKVGQKGSIDYEIPRSRVSAIEFDPLRRGEMGVFYSGLSASSPDAPHFKKMMRYRGDGLNAAFKSVRNGITQKAAKLNAALLPLRDAH